MKRVLFFCGGTMVPASRFRVIPIAEGLRKRGWDVEIDFGFSDIDQRIGNMQIKKGYRILRRLFRAYRTIFKKFDGPVVIQRLSLPVLAIPEVILAKRNRMIIFDFDDAIFLNSAGAPNGLRNRAFKKICAHSSHIVAGNSWLANKVDSTSQVTIVPTCIDTKTYIPNINKANTEVLRIGWIGTSGNLANLQVLIEPLRKLRESGYSFEFIICSDVHDAMLVEDLQAKFEKWSSEKELKFLQSLDIGIMPLFDNDWSKGKCSFKMIQYMSVGCPVVASAVGMNKDVLKDNIGGILVNKNDWYSPLARLMDSSATRFTFARQARERAVEAYDVSAAIDAYEAILTAQLATSVR